MRKLNAGHLVSAVVIGAVSVMLAGCPTNPLLEEVQQKVRAQEDSGKTAATPSFSPSAGTYSSDQSVTITDSTDGATIYYTTTGATPTTSSTKYTGAISVAGNGTTLTIKAMAVNGSMTASEVASATYVIDYSKVSTPSFSPSAGTYSSDQSVTISDSTDGATIYYTTDGSTPTASSTKYGGAISVAADGTTVTINAIAVKSGMADSTVATATYVINYSQVSTPSFSPSAGTYSSDQSVTISDSTDGVTIYYTTNGSTPTTSSTKYTGAISVAGSGTTLTLTAIAVKSGMANSTTASATYVITYGQVATPSFSPSAGTYSSDQSVTISDSTSGATIYYTTNGTVPTTSSTKYTGAIPVAADGTTLTLTAIAVKSGMTNSGTASATFVIHYPITTPSGLTLSSVSAGGLTASWTSTGAQSYQLYRCTSASGSYTQVYSGSSTSYVESGTLMPDATYYYEIMATYAAGNSSFSSSVSATTLNCLYSMNYGSKTIEALSMGTDGSLASSATLSVSYTPDRCAVSPDRSYLYVTGEDSYVYVYRIGGGGALTLVQSCTAGAEMEGIAITPSGKYLYSADTVNNTIAAFSINSSTGALTALSPATYATGTHPISIAITPDGAHLYATVSGTGYVYALSINSSTGALTAISNYATGTAPWSIAVSPSGSFLYVDSFTYYCIVPFTVASSTGVITKQTTTTTTATFMGDLVITSDGTHLYATGSFLMASGSVYAYSINSSTGNLTLIGTYTAGMTPGGAVLNATSTYLYVANAGDGAITSFGINSSTGALTTKGTYGTGSSPQHLAVH